MTGASPLSLRYAVPDHPWTKAGKDSAAVRISMTVAEAGRHDGVLLTRVSEANLDTDEPVIELSAASGRINPDLTVGVDVTRARALKASAGICSPGVKLHGSGFIVSHGQALALGLGRRPGLDRHLRPYRNGRDLMGRSRQAWVLDFHGLSVEELRRDFPEAYQHLAETVREDRRAQVEKSPTADARAYLEAWWVFGKPRPDLRAGLADLGRYIVTVETAKHRVFQFLEGVVLADNMLICVADDDATTLAILSSKVHLAWCAASGGVLEDRPRYTKSRCFDPFPFPPRDEAQRGRLRDAGEALDAHRRTVLADNPDLTLTTLYNCLELVRAGAALDDRSEAVKQRGLVIILRDLHDAIDRLTLEAYGWPVETGDADIVARLVALNHERAQEEAAGHVRWLRPAYQGPRAGVAAAQTRALTLVPGEAPAQRRPRFPSDRYEQPLAVQAVLETSGPAASADLARRFSGGARLEPRISRVLTTLHRYGHVDRLPDGRWTASRAA